VFCARLSDQSAADLLVENETLGGELAFRAWSRHCMLQTLDGVSTSVDMAIRDDCPNPARLRTKTAGSFFPLDGREPMPDSVSQQQAEVIRETVENVGDLAKRFTGRNAAETTKFTLWTVGLLVAQKVVEMARDGQFDALVDAATEMLTLPLLAAIAKAVYEWRRADR
jgi:hypothetical protein